MGPPLARVLRVRLTARKNVSVFSTTASVSLDAKLFVISDMYFIPFEHRFVSYSHLVTLSHYPQTILGLTTPRHFSYAIDKSLGNNSNATVTVTFIRKLESF